MHNVRHSRTCSSAPSGPCSLRATLWSPFGPGTFERADLWPLDPGQDHTKHRPLGKKWCFMSLMCLCHIYGRALRKGCCLENWRRDSRNLRLQIWRERFGYLGPTGFRGYGEYWVRIELVVKGIYCGELGGSSISGVFGISYAPIWRHKWLKSVLMSLLKKKKGACSSGVLWVREIPLHS